MVETENCCLQLILSFFFKRKPFLESAPHVQQFWGGARIIRDGHPKNSLYLPPLIWGGRYGTLVCNTSGSYPISEQMIKLAHIKKIFWLLAQNEVQTNFFSFSFFHNTQFRMCVYLEKKTTALTGLAGAPGQFLFTKGHFLTDSAMSGTLLIPKCLIC